MSVGLRGFSVGPGGGQSSPGPGSRPPGLGGRGLRGASGARAPAASRVSAARAHAWRPGSLPAGRAPGTPAGHVAYARVAQREDGVGLTHARRFPRPRPDAATAVRPLRFFPSRAKAFVCACVLPGLRLAEGPVRHWNSQRGEPQGPLPRPHGGAAGRGPGSLSAPALGARAIGLLLNGERLLSSLRRGGEGRWASEGPR